jgi:hypothetical protein
LTWQVLGTDDFGGVAIDSLVIDPRTAGGDTTVLYAGTTWAKTGSAPTYSGSRYADPRRPPYGAWLSRDSGQTWARIMPPGIHDDPVGNLLLDPSNPNNLDITFDGKGVYQTGDGGQTWAFLTRHVLHGQRFDLVRMAVAPRNPRVLCAAFEVYTQMKDYERIFRSANGGRSWRELNDTPNACGRQCFDNMLVAVDPTKPDTVYAGGTANYGYLDGSDPTCSRRIPFPHTALRPS